MFGLISKNKIIKKLDLLMADYKTIIECGERIDNQEMMTRGRLQYGVANRIKKEILEGDL